VASAVLGEDGEPDAEVDGGFVLGDEGAQLLVCLSGGRGTGSRVLIWRSLPRFYLKEARRPSPSPLGCFTDS
jgi:hypothetical protein